MYWWDSKYDLWDRTENRLNSEPLESFRSKNDTPKMKQGENLEYHECDPYYIYNIKEILKGSVMDISDFLILQYHVLKYILEYHILKCILEYQKTSIRAGLHDNHCSEVLNTT